MLIGLLLVLLAVLGAFLIVIAGAKKRLRAIGRRPRDLGALILIERFGQNRANNYPRFSRRTARMRSNSKLDSSAPSTPSSIEKPTSGNSSSSRVQDPHSALEAAAQGAFFGMDAFRNLLEIDEHVYEGMELLAGQQLDSIGDLSRNLASWESTEIGESLSEGAANKLMGHLAEPIVAQHLEDLGMQIALPDISNQKGYDLVIDGEHALNVKTVADADSLASHFEEYPEIHVVVPADMTGIPDNAIYIDAAGSLDQLNERVEIGHENIVIVDNALSHADLAEHAETVGDTLLGNMDPGGIPIITLVLSGYRELRLIAEGHTDVLNAYRNLGLDVIGTGVGGYGGAAGGAALGTILLPGIGTFIGLLAGGIGGAAGGRYFSDRMKSRRFRKARKKFEYHLGLAQKTLSELQRDTRRRYEDTVRAHQDSLCQSAEAGKNSLAQSRALLIRNRRILYRISPEKGQELLDSVLSGLDDDIRLLRRLRSGYAWIGRFPLGTTRSELQTQIDQLGALTKRLEIEGMAILGHPPRQDLIGERATQFLQLLLAVDGDTNSIRRLVERFEVKRKELEEAWRDRINEARIALAECRFHSMADVASKISQLNDEIGRRIGVIRLELKPYEESVELELRKLGKRMQ